MAGALRRRRPKEGGIEAARGGRGRGHGVRAVFVGRCRRIGAGRYGGRGRRRRWGVDAVLEIWEGDV